MDKKSNVLKIYLFSQPLLNTEWFSLLGDKYIKSLPFGWEFTHVLDNADIVVWDGVISSKLEYYKNRLLERLEGGAILLLMGDMRTLLENHPFVELTSLDQLRYVEVAGWDVLPEELLMAISQCHQKLTHV